MLTVHIKSRSRICIHTGDCQVCTQKLLSEYRSYEGYVYNRDYSPDYAEIRIRLDGYQGIRLRARVKYIQTLHLFKIDYRDTGFWSNISRTNELLYGFHFECSCLFYSKWFSYLNRGKRIRRRHSTIYINPDHMVFQDLWQPMIDRQPGCIRVSLQHTI